MNVDIAALRAKQLRRGARPRIEQTGVFAKPKRTTLSVTGKLGREPSLAALKDGLVKIGANELPLTFALAQKPMKVHLGKTTLDLAKLRELLPPDKPALSGKLAVDGFDRAKGFGESGKHGLAGGRELNPSAVSREQPLPCRFLKLPDALAHCAWCKRKLMSRLFHLSNARHSDKSVQQCEAPDHEKSLAQLNSTAKSIACGSLVSA